MSGYRRMYLVMNIARFMRVIFWSFLKKGYMAMKMLKKILINWFAVPNFGIIEYSLLTF